MAGEKKSQKPLAQSDTEWGDSFSVSKKARRELEELNEYKDDPPIEDENSSKKQTPRLKEYSNYSGAVPKTAKVLKTTEKKSEAKTEFNSQFDNVSNEISSAISEIESTLEKFVTQIIVELKNFVLSIYNLFLKFILLVFVQPLKNAGKYSIVFLELINSSMDDLNNYLSGNNKNSKKAQINKTKASAVKEQDIIVQEVPKKEEKANNGIVFSELAKKGIVFLNIKNTELYDPNLKGITYDEELDILKRGLKEINDCARLAKSLPSPTKGKYVNMQMEEILKNAQMDDLRLFLQYVYTHPKPFIERKLRLSEAFATWAHKGAPV